MHMHHPLIDNWKWMFFFSNFFNWTKPKSLAMYLLADLERKEQHLHISAEDGGSSRADWRRVGHGRHRLGDRRRSRRDRGYRRGGWSAWLADGGRGRGVGCAAARGEDGADAGAVGQRWVIAFETKIQLPNAWPTLLSCVIWIINWSANIQVQILPAWFCWVTTPLKKEPCLQIEKWGMVN